MPVESQVDVLQKQVRDLTQTLSGLLSVRAPREGRDGRDGSPGADGRNGIDGIQGKKGDIGPVGPMGPVGPQGDQGEVGPMGPIGPQGEPGPPGEKGDQGERGELGPPGARGFKGEKGDKGEPGRDGRDGEVGPVGPPGPPGESRNGGGGAGRIVTYNADGTVNVAGVVRSPAYISNGAVVNSDGSLVSGGAPITISGLAVVGSTLTAAIAAGWQNTGGNWTRNGTNISGETALTYLLAAADAGQSITYKSGNIPYVPPAFIPAASVPGAPTIGTATGSDGSVSVAFTAPSSNGGSTILDYTVTLSTGQTATGSASPIVVSAPNGIAVTATVRARNAIGTGAASAASNSVTPGAIILPLEYASNVTSLVTAIRAIGTQRTVVPFLGMSIVAGVGSSDTFGVDWQVARASSIAPRLGAALTAQYGGTQSYGIEGVKMHQAAQAAWTSSSLVDYGYNGPRGTESSMTGAGSNTTVIAITTTRPNQVVRIYGRVSGNAGIVTPRYSMSGANTLGVTNLPTSTTAVPLPGGVSWSYSTDITIPNVGTTNLALRAPATSGHNFTMWTADLDYDLNALPGITVQRCAQSSLGATEILAVGMDNTDTQPAGTWVGSGTPADRRAGQAIEVTTRVAPGMPGFLFASDVNDIQMYAALGYTLADIGRHFDNIISWASAQSLKTIFVTGLSIRDPSQYSGSPPYTQQSIIDAIRTRVAASSNCALIDLTGLWTGATLSQKYASQIANTNYWLAAEAPNYLHPSAAGHQMFADAIARALIAA